MAKKRKQIAALPVARDEDGSLKILVITSRETKRFIVPKGWPMKGRSDRAAAEIEALEEAGLVGRVEPKAIGKYQAWKRLGSQFQLVDVKVFLLFVERQIDDWKEKGQREMSWLGVEDAALLLDEPGLAGVVLDLPRRLPSGWRSRPKGAPKSFKKIIG